MLLRLNIAACLLKIKEANQALKECEAVSEQEGKKIIWSDESLLYKMYIVTFLMAIEFCMFKFFFYKLFILLFFCVFHNFLSL